MNRIKRHAKLNYYSNKSKEYKNNTKNLWQLINSQLGKCKHKGSIIPYISVGGIRTNDPKAIVNSFGKFYSELGMNLASTIKPSQMLISAYISNIPRNLHSIFINPTNQQEIEKIITNLPNKTSPSHNGVSNTLLKKLNKSISYPLSIIFNQSINQGVFPDLMKQAEVIPLYKGQQQDMVVNYHPISLLMTISKLLEKILYTRIYKFLDKNNILYESQFGFQSNHSWEHAIAELIGRLLQAKEQDQHSAAIFLDLLKAFDTLNHEVLLMKLECYGKRDTAHKWFESYLHNRSLVAKVTTSTNNTTYSDSYDISYGTAQGNCLGPLLIFCNDVHRLPLYGHIILFADNQFVM